MEFSYQLNCGQYVLHRDGAPVGPLLDEVALVFSTTCGTLHKHGKPDLVGKWLDTTRDKFRKAGFTEMADELVLVQGRFSLADLNKCLSTTGYVLNLYKQIQAGQVASLDFLGNVVQPA